MKMLSASTLAALALGLMLSGSAAYAADGRGSAQGSQDQDTQQPNDPNDQNDRVRHGKPPVKVETPTPTNTNTGHQANDRNSQNDRRDWNRRNDQNDRRVGERNNRNNWNHKNNRRNVDLSRWHRNFDAPRRFNAGSYHAPRGYNYRRYSYGQRLPRDYYARNFWLMSFISFGLLAPPPGYVWVRYGPDALLIDIDTGEIVQVQYNVFYS